MKGFLISIIIQVVMLTQSIHDRRETKRPTDGGRSL